MEKGNKKMKKCVHIEGSEHINLVLPWQRKRVYVVLKRERERYPENEK